MKCPFCKEDIQDGAIKCRHCGSMLNSSETVAAEAIPQFAMPQQGIQHMAQQVDNTLIWTLAFAPILGAILEQVLKNTLGNAWLFQFATLALNITLAVMDEKKLQQLGYDTSSFGGAWLIPVYLYKRAKMFNHNLAYFIVWIVCFVILFL
ncbi:MAG: zinc ribbon domain-containing protein [Geobacteraceae bacterium]|nr:zinc ribbon domain-containing protein [Geobacteraceae bacterium]